MPALIDALQHERLYIRWNAAKALGNLGPLASEAIPALTAALQDEKATVRERAAEALMRIRPDDDHDDR